MMCDKSDERRWRYNRQTISMWETANKKITVIPRTPRPLKPNHLCFVAVLLERERLFDRERLAWFHCDSNHNSITDHPFVPPPVTALRSRHFEMTGATLPVRLIHSHYDPFRYFPSEAESCLPLAYDLSSLSKLGRRNSIFPDFVTRRAIILLFLLLSFRFAFSSALRRAPRRSWRREP